MRIVLDKVSFIEVIIVLNLDIRLKLGSFVFFGSFNFDSYVSVVSSILNGIYEKVSLFIFVVSIYFI